MRKPKLLAKQFVDGFFAATVTALLLVMTKIVYEAELIFSKQAGGHSPLVIVAGLLCCAALATLVKGVFCGIAGVNILRKREHLLRDEAHLKAWCGLFTGHIEAINEGLRDLDGATGSIEGFRSMVLVSLGLANEISSPYHQATWKFQKEFGQMRRLHGEGSEPGGGQILQNFGKMLRHIEDGRVSLPVDMLNRLGLDVHYRPLQS